MEAVTTMARERTYRGVFTCTTGKPTWLTLDFYAENLDFAWAHAVQVAGHDEMHKEWGPIKLEKVLPISVREFVDAGGFQPCAPPMTPLWRAGRR
jgi:hypothetical protein